MVSIEHGGEGMGGIGNYPYLVHYVWTGTRNAGDCRPAAVVREWEDDQLNLAVFPDGTNDGDERLVVWATSVAHGTDGVPGTWHHARECDPKAAPTQAAPEASAQPAEEPAQPAPLPPEELWSLGDQAAYLGGDAE